VLNAVLWCDAARTPRQLSPIKGETVGFIPTVQVRKVWAKPLHLAEDVPKTWPISLPGNGHVEGGMARPTIHPREKRGALMKPGYKLVT
jgi:hypothetical protein